MSFKIKIEEQKRLVLKGANQHIRNITKQNSKNLWNLN